jgi:hypothetical protein
MSLEWTCSTEHLMATDLPGLAGEVIKSTLDWLQACYILWCRVLARHTPAAHKPFMCGSGMQRRYCVRLS